MGVKLDSRIIYDDQDQPERHEVIWILQWNQIVFLSPDYYAHDLYMDSTTGATFLDLTSPDLRIETNLPLTKIYRNAPGSAVNRLGWASYRPAEIQANTLYTVTLISPPTTITQNWSRLEENYGFRIPFGCTANCLWVPVAWCDVNEGGQSLLLRNNIHPAGIHPLGAPQGDCNGLPPLFLPIIFL